MAALGRDVDTVGNMAVGGLAAFEERIGGEVSSHCSPSVCCILVETAHLGDGGIGRSSYCRVQ